MTRNVAYLLKGGIVFLAGLLVAFAVSLVAFADEDDGEDLNMTAYELELEIEERQAAYAAAREEVDAAAASMDETLERIEELEKQIPVQQERSAQAAREQYKLKQQGVGVVNLLLGADDFYSFLNQLEYMSRISDANTAEMNRLSQLKDEIVAQRDELKTAQRDAEAKAEEARKAMEAAQEAQAEVQRRIEEEARAQAEIAAMAAALAEEPRDNDSGAPASGGTGAVDSPPITDDGGSGGSGGSGDAEKTDDVKADEAGNADGGDEGGGEVAANDDSLEGWTARIDAYLAGSPLAGQGKTFAEAALKYGVDPRLSPAISFTESSKGLCCFLPHNAWGWGSSSWSSWEEAIDAHVGGLARGYGGQLSIEGAKKYCPPNWKTWYDRTLAQMNMI